MKILKCGIQGLIGLLLAAAAAIAVSTWVFPAENDELLVCHGFRIGVAGIGAGLALLVLFAFADGWVGTRDRRGGTHFPATLFHGIGFGLLPGIAVWKAFEQGTPAGRGIAVPEQMPQIPWWTAESAYLPCRIEMTLALAAFGAMILWLALRKEDLPENGDLLPAGVTLWGTVRLITGAYHATRILFPENAWAVSAIAAAGMGISLLFWAHRVFRTQKNTGYAYACIPVFVISVAGIVLQDLGILTVNPLADQAIRIVCALLAMKAVLCLGRISRQKTEAPFPYPANGMIP